MPRRITALSSTLAAALLGLALSVNAFGSVLPKLSIANVTVSEGSCTSQVATFTVTVSAPFGENATVQFATADGTAIAGTDYKAVSGTLSFSRGSKSPQTITVTIADVLIPGTNKTFYVNLSNPQNATLTNSRATATIVPPTVAKCQSCGISCNKGDACFTDSCDAMRGCQHVNTSATATPFCRLAGLGITPQPDPNFAACNASGEWIDSDGDGFSDAEEIQGYIDVNGNGVYDAGIDVPLPGADPHKPDVYIHYDYFYASDHDHNPPPEAIQWVIDAFAARGMRLHIDPQHNAISESTGKVVTELALNNPDPACVGPSAVTMHELRQTYFPPHFYLAYHYVVFSHWSTCDSALDCARCAADPECGGGLPPTPAYGHGEIGGEDAIVSFGLYIDAGRPIPATAVSGVTMHELGHNLGLKHGGPGSCDNYKPNYLSIMNYNFYTTGILVGAAPGDTIAKSCVTDADCTAPAHCSGPNGSIPNICSRIDYSGVRLADLNECATVSTSSLCVPLGSTGGLDETKGLNESPTSTDISVFTTDGITPIYVPTNGTPIDWNQDRTLETNVTQDINGDGAHTLLSGANDWANLNFDYQCSANYDPTSQAAVKLPFEQLLQRYWLAAKRSQPTSSRASNTAVQVVGASGQAPARSSPAVDWLKERSLLPQ